jgi:hypothetical protein
MICRGQTPSAELMNTLEDSKQPRRVIPAPPPSNPRLRSVVLDVECTQQEDVEWYWTETAEGRYVSGYRIVPR